MPGNSFGERFRITTFGESHGVGLGVVMDGVPAGFALDLPAIERELARRRPGQSALTTPRKEADAFEVLSGLFEGRTLGSPLTFLFRNLDADARAYVLTKDLYRPSHSDFTTQAKYSHRDWRGGGRASARETVARVTAGAVARQLIAPIEIVAWVHRVGDIEGPDVWEVDPAAVEATLVRSHPAVAGAMEALIREVRADGDSIGGVIRAVCRNVPVGLGEPVFDKLEADLAKAMLSLPAAKGFESGSGYAGTRMRGSQHNDAFVPGPNGFPITTTNRSGGIQGGISNGMPVTFTVAFKPVATIFQPQATVDIHNQPATLTPRGRHDPCVLPRAVPIVEAMAAIVLADHVLRGRSSR